MLLKFRKNEKISEPERKSSKDLTIKPKKTHVLVV
jgi:hypothetical protein